MVEHLALDTRRTECRCIVEDRVRGAAGDLEQTAIDQADRTDPDDLGGPTAEASEQIRILGIELGERPALADAANEIEQQSAPQRRTVCRR